MEVLVKVCFIVFLLYFHCIFYEYLLYIGKGEVFDENGRSNRWKLKYYIDTEVSYKADGTKVMSYRRKEMTVIYIKYLLYFHCIFIEYLLHIYRRSARHV